MDYYWAFHDSFILSAAASVVFISLRVKAEFKRIYIGLICVQGQQIQYTVGFLF